MTIEQTDKVDGIGIDRKKNEVVLIISDHLSWDNENIHINLLEKKIDGYLNYIKSGQYLDNFQDYYELPIRFNLIFQHNPPKSVSKILQILTNQLKSVNILFSYGPIHIES